PWQLVIDTTRIDSEDSSRLQRRSRHFAPFHECVGSSFFSQPLPELSRQQGQRFADRAGHSSSPIPPGQGSDPDLFPSGHTPLFAYLKERAFSRERLVALDEPDGWPEYWSPSLLLTLKTPRRCSSRSRRYRG